MALKGFEDITHEITGFEKSTLLPFLMEELLKHKGKPAAITNADLRQLIFAKFDKKIMEPRIRKLAEYMRQANLVIGLIAGRNGYFIAQTAEEIDEWIECMRQRRNALNASIQSGERSKKMFTGYRQPNQYKNRKAAPGETQALIFQQ